MNGQSINQRFADILPNQEVSNSEKGHHLSQVAGALLRL
jgi:hypothetical protein